MNANTTARRADAALLACFSFRGHDFADGLRGMADLPSGSKTRRYAKKVTRRARRVADKAACMAV